jgi:hypothetical protein
VALTPSPPSRLSLAILLVIASAGMGLAQPATSTRHSSWEFNLHAAALKPGLFDESAGGFQVGGRLFRNFASGVSIGANVDWAAPQDVTLAPFGSSSASLLLYSAELDYRFQVSPRAAFFLGAGVGAATLSLDEVPVGVAQSSTGLLVPVGGGIKVHNRAIAPSWAIRFDVRDNVILLETLNADGGTSTEPRNNVEASVGFSFLFGRGGGGAEIAAERDTDRDGIPDPRDFCLNRPGAVVDARGCPLRPEQPAPEPDLEPVAETDRDQDGVPDSRDGCLGTPSGIAVEADGCPTPPAEPAVEAPPGDSDGDGVVDDRDACPGTPAGLSIDERGCLARPEPREEAPERIEALPIPGAFPVPAEPAPDLRPVPDAVEPAQVLGACLDPTGGRKFIEFDERRFESAGFPQPVDRQFLVSVGAFDGIPIYVSDTARPPYTDFWVPRCGPGNLFELYVEVGALP